MIRAVVTWVGVGISASALYAYDGNSAFYKEVNPKLDPATSEKVLKAREAMISWSSDIVVAARNVKLPDLTRQASASHQEPATLSLPTHGSYDFVVVGGGIVGTAIARQLLIEHPNRTVCLIEKEPALAQHQTSHNSGVIHAGIYHAPGSLMGLLCVRGMKLMYEFCEKNKLPAERVGKLVVALREDQIPYLHKLKANGEAAGQTELEIIDAARIRELEPNVVGVAALSSPNTGIADFAAITRRLGAEIAGEAPFTVLSTSTRPHPAKSSQQRGKIVLRRQVVDVADIGNGCRVTMVEPGHKGPSTSVDCKVLVTAAGLHMDSVGTIAGGRPGPYLIPFRGKYYQLRDDRKHIVKRNIYPVPPVAGDPGVHFTPTVDGPRGNPMIVGPSFSVALAKEAYRSTQIDPWHALNVVTSTAFWKFAYEFGANAVAAQIGRDLFFANFLAEAQQMVPSVTARDLVPSYTGVMANSFDPATGKAYPDYVFEVTAAKPHAALEAADKNGVVRTAAHMTRRVLNLRHAPSPAGTSSLALAEHIASIVETELKLALL